MLSKFEQQIKGISHDENSPIPVYCDASTKHRHEQCLIRLFNLNFGKDWVFFLNLFYWEKFGKHHIVFKNPHKLEDNKQFYLLRRKAYYKQAKNLMEFYFQHTYEEAQEAIMDDKYRIKWSDTPNKKETLEVYISSKIYDQVYPE